MNHHYDSFYRSLSTNVSKGFYADKGGFSFLMIRLALLSGAMGLTPCLVSAQTALPVTLDGIIHPDSDDTLAFTPDGSTVFFDRSEGSHKTIMLSHHVRGHWSKPEVASFSGQWFDQDPLVAPDGGYLLFNSDRPVKPGGKPLTQNFFVGGTAPGSNIWRVDRTADGWGKPVWLGRAVNNDVFIDFASLASDSTLYFIRWNQTEKAMHIWRSIYKEGQYLPAELVTIGDPVVSVHDPAVAPDESFMILDYGKVKGGLGRLCISFRDGDHWGKPIDFGDAINKDLPWGAHLAPDAHTVYVTGQSGISRISLDPWLNARRRDSEAQFGTSSDLTASHCAGR